MACICIFGIAALVTHAATSFLSKAATLLQTTWGLSDVLLGARS
jgi:hypothetical protein